MPGFDRTGPLGRGQMTGRRLGYCRQSYPQTQEQQGDNSSQRIENGTSNTDQTQQPLMQQHVVYGVGRGGIPCGCGRGRRGRRF